MNILTALALKWVIIIGATKATRKLIQKAWDANEAVNKSNLS